MTHPILLCLHIAAAMLLVGGSAAARLAEAAVADAADLPTLRGALDGLGRAARLNPAFAIVLLLTGAALGSGWWGTTWFWVAVAGWAANTGLAARVVGPARRALQLAAESAGRGPISAEVDALRRRRVPAIARDAMLGLDVGILLLMVSKPSAGAAVLWPLAAAALSIAIGQLRPIARGRRGGAAALEG
jgi:hypothetical protein